MLSLFSPLFNTPKPVATPHFAGLTTLLVSPRTEGLDLLGVKEPEDEILEQPEQHLAMHSRQRVSRDGGGERPRREAKAALSGKA